MTFFKISSALAFIASASIAVAQNVPAPNQQTDVQLLQKQMLEMQAGIRQMQAQHAQEIEGLKAQVAAQQKALDDFQKMAGASAPPPSCCSAARRRVTKKSRTCSWATSSS